MNRLITLNQEFKTVAEIINNFGHNVKLWLKAIAKHRNENTSIWCAKAFKCKKNEWDNIIHEDGDYIQEKNKNIEERIDHVNKFLSDNPKDNTIRITFLKINKSVYRYFGTYTLDKSKTNTNDGVYWKRIATEIETY